MRIRAEANAISLTLIVFVLGLASAPASSDGGPGPLQLITSEEADMPINTTVARRTEPRNDGPAINISSPQNGAAFQGAFPIDIVFEPGANGLAVDMKSLKLEYQRAWGIDITSRVRDYIDGLEIHVGEAELPEGRHSVEIQIQDTEENLSTLLFTVTVVDDD